MKLKSTWIALMMLGTFGTTLQASSTGASLFEAKCSMCHMTTHPTDKSTMLAPPVMGVMRHVKMRYPDKQSAVAFVSAYALNPQASKAVCMPQKIQRFGLMPSQQGSVTQEELEQIASWMYDNFPPKGFQSRGRGKGQGHGEMKQHQMWQQ